MTTQKRRRSSLRGAKMPSGGRAGQLFAVGSSEHLNAKIAFAFSAEQVKQVKLSRARGSAAPDDAR